MEIQKRFAVHSACAALLLISIATTVRAQTATDNALPDAPDAVHLLAGASSPEVPAWEAITPSASASATRPASSSAVTLRECPYDHTHARICGVHWGQLVISAAIFNAFQ